MWFITRQHYESSSAGASRFRYSLPKFRNCPAAWHMAIARNQRYSKPNKPFGYGLTPLGNLEIPYLNLKAAVSCLREKRREPLPFVGGAVPDAIRRPRAALRLF
jgi:hypothetical protein